MVEKPEPEGEEHHSVNLVDLEASKSEGVEAEKSTQDASVASPSWQGSSLRASMNAVPEPKAEEPLPEGPYIKGELGMHLRVA